MDLITKTTNNNNNILPQILSSPTKYSSNQLFQRKRLVQQKRSPKKSAKKLNDGILIEENKKEEIKEVKEEEEIKEEENKLKEEENNNNEEGRRMFKYSPQQQHSSSSTQQCSPSSPLPSFNNNPLLRGINNKTIIQQRQHSSSSSSSSLIFNKNVNSFKRCSSARLVCNFEESILSGRLVPSSIVDGYSLQLMVVPIQSISPGGGFLSVQRVNCPVQAFFFFNEMSNTSIKTPALLHLARCELSSEGIFIPRRCNLQAVLFNPQGSVIKIFMVEIDVHDMPPSSTTFIRQRTFNETKTTITGNNNNKNILLLHLFYLLPI
ncbi:DUF4210 domain-containing protein [Meloidogyne graminicola]|uniref:DUF4210 domain-containing protein n=1 Tax=Meloidogyne graminicola TaxID=189291 RepID=A0A8S9ZSX4_9BILA|nr:DUF4210 domain-containing protein [Meloidogyne graminicola]KAF7636130.1 DUF4210 domain-containing protein [Meloidogyne graminicola]